MAHLPNIILAKFSRYTVLCCVVTKSQTLAGNRWSFLSLTDYPLQQLFAVLLVTTNPLPGVAMEIFLDML